MEKQISRNASSASTDNSKPKKSVIFWNSILKSLQMEKINKLLNSRVVQLKSSPGSKTKQLSYALLILEKYEYDTSITLA